jgi:hypothetical protein
LHQSPFAPQALPQFIATTGSSDSHPSIPLQLLIPRGIRRTRRPLRRVSHPSQQFFQCALSPTTPTGLVSAFVPVSSSPVLASPSSEGWPPIFASRGLTEFTPFRIRARIFAISGSHHLAWVVQTAPFRKLRCLHSPGVASCVTVNSHHRLLSFDQILLTFWLNRRRDGRRAVSFNITSGTPVDPGRWDGPTAPVQKYQVNPDHPRPKPRLTPQNQNSKIPAFSSRRCVVVSSPPFAPFAPFAVLPRHSEGG